MLAIAGLVVSPFALLLAAPLIFARRAWPRALAGAALAGLCACALLAPFAYGEARVAFDAFAHPGAHARDQRTSHRVRHHRRRHRHHHRHHSPQAPTLPDLGRNFGAAWPHVRAWWLLLLPSAPALALAFAALRPRSLADDQRAAERSAERTLERQRRRADRKAARLARPERRPTLARDERVALLGAKVHGELVLPERGGAVGLPLAWLHSHALVIGPSGTGKTETLLRLAYGAAAAGGWPVYYIDAKGDRAGAERFRALMASAGRHARVFPDEPLDCWRGSGQALYNRLIELVAFATEGDGAWYRDVAKRCLQLACTSGEPPRSADELLARLEPDNLAALDPRLARLLARELQGVALRYASFFDALGGKLEGGFGFEDADAAYLMLDSLALKEDAHSLARILVEDFAHFAAERRPRDEPALLIIDEFSAIAEAARVVDLVERLRSFGVAVVLAPQVVEGIGEEAARERIVQNCETVILHALKRPERIIELAGTRRELEASYQHERGEATGLGTGRAQHVYKVDPNEVRALPPGDCFVIRRGGAVRVRVARAPESGGSATSDPRGPTLRL